MKEITSKILKIMFFVGLMSTILEISMYFDWVILVGEKMPNVGVLLGFFLGFFGMFGMFVLIILVCITGIAFLIASAMYLIAYLLNRKTETKWKKIIGIVLIIIATIISAVTTFVYARLESIVFSIDIFKGVIYAIPAIIDILCYIYVFVKLINSRNPQIDIEKKIETEIKNEISE